jgi:hypothetical protein
MVGRPAKFLIYVNTASMPDLKRASQWPLKKPKSPRRDNSQRRYANPVRLWRAQNADAPDSG